MKLEKLVSRMMGNNFTIQTLNNMTSDCYFKSTMTEKSINDKDEIRSQFWTEYAVTTTYLSKVITIKSGSKCPYELFFEF
jgi:hypothetical protein